MIPNVARRSGGNIQFTGPEVRFAVTEPAVAPPDDDARLIWVTTSTEPGLTDRMVTALDGTPIAAATAAETEAVKLDRSLAFEVSVV